MNRSEALMGNTNAAKDKDLLRDDRIAFRCRHEFKERWQRLATERGISLSDFILDIMTRHAG